MKKRTEKISERIHDELSICDDLSAMFQDILDNADQSIDIEEFKDSVFDYIREREIIYYGKAMAFLFEHDPSLKESLEIAADLGYEIESLNSELLATLLLQQQLENEFSDLLPTIEKIFEEEEEEEEEEEN